MGYPVTGQLTAYEQDLLISSYHRAQAGGYSVTQAAVYPEGSRSLLKHYQAEQAGVAPQSGTTVYVAPQPAAPATTTAVVTRSEATPATTTAALPNLMGAAADRSLASHCNAVSLVTSSNGGFTTQAPMTDPSFALNENNFAWRGPMPSRKAKIRSPKSQGSRRNRWKPNARVLVPR